MKTVIVGGVAGGASAAARLRRLDEKGEIILFERGEHISFANCGLPYYVGGVITQKSALTLQTPASFNGRFCVDVRNFSNVTAIDRTAKTVTVQNTQTGESYTESYDKLVLSMGAEPIRPPLPGVELEGVFTLRNIPDTLAIRQYIEEKKPASAVVVGGGYIGVEMAENLMEAGLSVTVVELADHLIAPLDFDMAVDVHRYLASKGAVLKLNNGLKSIEKAENGLSVTLSDGQVEAGLVLMAVGVRPESALAKDAGLEVNARGSIVVDEHMLTSDPDIYAVGDAVESTDFITGQKGFVPLAGPANRQGRIAADNICGIPSTYGGTQGSAILKVFDMTVAATGINEKTAKAAGLHYDKVFLYSAPHASYYPGGSPMSLKVLYEKPSGKLLGAQIVGFEGVDKRCDVLATAIRLGATAIDLTRLELCYAPPYSSAKDPVNMAGFVMENDLTGKVKTFHWHDVAALPRDGSVTLLDVRTVGEVAHGKIEGFINIPLDSLRERLDELDNSKPIYVHCHSGLRSYVACRILAGHGFDCHNLSGGWRLYNAVVNI
ncbi:FAD-dependent oxidoreductase [Oscillospiraceae bacterium MB08-C2-2]|nr:FAD-dependent oxidoreductase [Oscillospiraceae bacterium MB08-C2-2]